jgi:hypothetical protein
MSIRLESRAPLAKALLFLFSIAVLMAPALGQSAPREAPEDQDMRAWLGCWDVIADPEDDSQESRTERQMICVAPGGTPRSIDMTVLVDGKSVAEETIITDGSRQPVSDDGCEGWIRSVLSEDRRRLYLQSEATCAGRKSKYLTGVSMMVAGERWIDIHVMRVDGERELVIQRYRPIESGIARLPGALPSTMSSLRRDAAERITIEEIIAALRVVDPAVVEAMLLESKASFGIDADLLLRLARAGVPDEVIDLMVALSFPEHFSIEGSTVTRQPEVYYGSYWSPWYPYYGYGYGYYYHHRHSHHAENRGGKVISGRGYVSVQQTSAPSGGLSGLFGGTSNTGGGFGMTGGNTGGRSSGKSGSASGSGYQSGNSRPSRPAIPKPR